MTEDQKEARANHCRQIAHLGGLRTKQIYGDKFFAEIGKVGFQAYADKYFDGHRGNATNSLVGKGKTIGGTRWRNSVKVKPEQMAY